MRCDLPVGEWKSRGKIFLSYWGPLWIVLLGLSWLVRPPWLVFRLGLFILFGLLSLAWPLSFRLVALFSGVGSTWVVFSIERESFSTSYWAYKLNRLVGKVVISCV